VLRNIAAVVFGLVVGSAANMAVLFVNMAIFPAPADFDMYDPVQMTAYIETLPQTAFLLVMVAHLTQAGLGGWLAAKLGGSRPMALAMVVAVLTLLGGVMNAMSIPMPLWMYLEFPLYLVVGWAAGNQVAKSRAE
jgi:nitrate/nitrite transporter NarK